ncbi:glycosyl hydrolases family 31-domain-containing protein [Rhizoctonia solani]|nr:glycosyl hydrolases family 31-domain-containing protein [Rhizoctonia solani]
MGYYDKQSDPYRYVKALDFFYDLDNGRTQYERIKNVDLEPSQFDSSKNVIHEACYHGLAFRDQDKGKILIIQFPRPNTFRVLFDPEKSTLDDYKKGNSRNIVQDTFQGLVETLDKFENTDWEVGYDTQTYPGHIVLESRFKKSPPISGGLDKDYALRIFVRQNPFKIFALRRIKVYNTREEQLLQAAKVLTVDDSPTEKVIWQTKQNGILYSGKMTLFEVEKPGTARYLGFGEQGGRQVLKSKQICDYFNFDNMTYSQVYNQGPLDSREPLYHSEPFWMEIAQHPGYQLKLATFVDNLSQVCLDIGSKNNSTIRTATRFGCMRMYVVTADSIPKLINCYTSIVGRPQLKPRYVLGYHQACYGYDNDGWVRSVIKRYRDIGFPIDGMHIDVDFQRGYRTFTVDEQGAFRNPQALLGDLRNQGVKCSTNITPFINNASDGIDYPTLREGLDKGYFIKDKRYTAKGGPSNAYDDRYMVYRSSNRDEWAAADPNQEPKNKYTPPDTQPLSDTWNTGKPFRGGVYYGANLGNPGHYPDLNRKEVRIWWGKQYQHLMDLGLEFVWQDMTSPCIGAGYGDMKRQARLHSCLHIPFRLLITSDEHKGSDSRDAAEAELPAIQVWALFSLNLHKATYHGWNHNASRSGRRNFIIGRGGFIGLHRYAGLWTGDNASTWEFLKVSVAQVLSLGLSGITISGGDVGGFEPGHDNGKWASPELLMRWYLAYCLLPWFRNHYNRKMDKKEFQEPYRFIDKISQASPDQQWMYRATLPVCQYYVKLRYSLLQCMYDQMFDNLLTGLPIARSLVISNEDDGSLVTENEDFLDDTYTLGDDILVAPVLGPQLAEGRPDTETRMIYLPAPDSWWQFNLRADGPDAAGALGGRFDGGTLMPYDARMSDNVSQIPYMNPMFIRYGAIIPQIEPRLYAEDWTKPNPIAIHVYPGRIGFNKSYDMYLDDGVSRESAPTADNLQKHLADNEAFNTGEKSKVIKSPLKPSEFGDDQAGNVFWRVRILQVRFYASYRGPESP